VREYPFRYAGQRQREMFFKHSADYQSNELEYVALGEKVEECAFYAAF